MAQRRGRGFASMDPEAQRAIASMGGRAAHESGHAHEWNSEEAAKAGHRGGLAAHRRNRAATHREGTPLAQGQGAPPRRGALPADAHAQGEHQRSRKVRGLSKHGGQHASGGEENSNHEERDPQTGGGRDSVP